MEYQVKHQEPIFLYQRLGWSICDRNSEARDPELNNQITIEIERKITFVEMAKSQKPQA